MNAARWRISGIGECVYEWKRSSSASTRLAEGAPCTKVGAGADAACEDEDRVRFGCCDFGGMLRDRFGGLAAAGVPECIDRIGRAASRAAVCFVDDRAHCRHIVLSAERAAVSIGSTMVNCAGVSPNTLLLARNGKSSWCCWWNVEVKVGWIYLGRPGEVNG